MHARGRLCRSDRSHGPFLHMPLSQHALLSQTPLSQGTLVFFWWCMPSLVHASEMNIGEVMSPARPDRGRGLIFIIIIVVVLLMAILCCCCFCSGCPIHKKVAYSARDKCFCKSDSRHVRIMSQRMARREAHQSRPPQRLEEGATYS